MIAEHPVKNCLISDLCSEFFTISEETKTLSGTSTESCIIIGGERPFFVIFFLSLTEGQGTLTKLLDRAMFLKSQRNCTQLHLATTNKIFEFQSIYL